MRQWFATRRIQFGPAFTGLIAVHTSGGDDGSTMLAEIALPGDIRSQQAGYGIHPALLDACFQSVAAVMVAAGRTDGGLLLPLGVTRLRRTGAGRDARYCLVRVLSSDATTIEADLDITDADGEVVLQAAGLRMGTRSPRAASVTASSLSDCSPSNGSGTNRRRRSQIRSRRLAADHTRRSRRRSPHNSPTR